MGSLLHEITFKSSNGYKKAPVILKDNAPATIKLQAGTWLINVNAYLDNMLYATGGDGVTVTISVGENKSVPIQMEVIYDNLLEDGNTVWVQSSSGTESFAKLEDALNSLSDDEGIISINGTYTIWIFTDQTIEPCYIGNLNVNDLNITFKSPKGVIISLPSSTNVSPPTNSGGHLFTVTSSATLTLEKGIILEGIPLNYLSLIKVDGGTLIMKEGSAINGNKNDGNNIYGGGIFVTANGKFVMEGGIISGNTVVYGNGGGVCVEGGTFIMEGGVISGNISSGNGGGVYVEQNGNFKKTGGIIYGENEDISSNKTQSGTGHAVYVEEVNDSVSGSSIIKRSKKVLNATAYEHDILDSEKNDGWEK
jgi:hypothetical protein